MPTVRIRSVRRARAASGNAVALPMSVMNSRRFMTALGSDAAVCALLSISGRCGEPSGAPPVARDISRDAFRAKRVTESATGPGRISARPCGSADIAQDEACDWKIRKKPTGVTPQTHTLQVLGRGCGVLFVVFFE